MSTKQPNIIIILADDMGFSDIGCFGSEIATPHLDSLAADGVRMSSFYNCARCCPTRATLMTGLYPHQAGVGMMTSPAPVPAYQGYLRKDAATSAEVLKEAGYATWCAGKWHCGGDYKVHMRDQWDLAGDENHPLPTQRGFDRYYGTLCGAGSYFAPPCLMDQETFIDEVDEDYYYTDAVSERACGFIDEAVATGKPFYGYIAYTAPHWPLHATEEDIAPYRGTYDKGWDVLRDERFMRLRDMGMLDSGWSMSPRDEESHPWTESERKQWEAERMAVYAAQVSAMDRGIGQVLETLKRHGALDDTIVVFCSDNGGCAEYLREDGEEEAWPGMYALPTNRGTMTVVGNDPKVQPGPAETFMSYDLPWANASNVPFRKFKCWTHEGGISTPFVVRWGNGGVNGNRIVHGAGHLIDLVATVEAAAGAPRPAQMNGIDIQPIAGKNMLPLWRGESDDIRADDEAIYWEHIENGAMRRGQYKIVRARKFGKWELYDMSVDRTELNDLADEKPELVKEMAADWQRWADSMGVMPVEEVWAMNRKG